MKTITRRQEFKTEDLNDIDYDATFVDLERGKIVTGTVVKVDPKEILVDVGGKSEGILPYKEISNSPIEDINELIQVGQALELFVWREANEDGQVTLSKRRVDQAKGWIHAQEDFKDNKIIKARVINAVRSGVLAEIHSIRGFIPASHLRTDVDELKDLEGEKLAVKIIDINQQKNKLILSHRKALEDERSTLRAEIVANLQEGNVITGKIVRLVDFGAFVDLGGIDGLLPISEISWKRISHPNEILKAGEEVTVKVFKIDTDLNRVSLSLKRMKEDPWEAIGNQFKEGDKIKGVVTKLAPFGAFVEIAEGVEALLPTNEISEEPIRLDESFPVGKEVEATIKKFNPSDRKISLTLKEYTPPPAKEESDSEEESNSSNEE